MAPNVDGRGYRQTNGKSHKLTTVDVRGHQGPTGQRDAVACSVDTQPRVLTDYSGSFSTPNFPDYYPDDSNCQWLIESQEPNGVSSFIQLLAEDKIPPSQIGLWISGEKYEGKGKGWDVEEEIKGKSGDRREWEERESGSRRMRRALESHNVLACFFSSK